jgi:hypothetical protein
MTSPRCYPDRGLGLLDGRGVTLLDHGLLGYAMFASPNLGRAIERHTKYQDVIGAALQTALCSATATRPACAW